MPVRAPRLAGQAADVEEFEWLVIGAPDLWIFSYLQHIEDSSARDKRHITRKPLSCTAR